MMHETPAADPTPSEDKKLEVLNDHYKDSVNYLQAFLRNRDKFFFYILITISVMLYQIYLPIDAKDMVGDLITKTLNLNKAVDASYVGTIIWFILLAFIVRYFQTVVYIENQYKYIHKLEDQLCAFYNNNAFTREGQTYLRNYKKFSKWIKKLYSIVFPLLLVLVIISKIYNEVVYANSLSILLIFNIFIFFSIIFFVLLYLKVIHAQ